MSPFSEGCFRRAGSGQATTACPWRKQSWEPKPPSACPMGI